MKKIIAIVLALGILGIAAFAMMIVSISGNLPQIIKVSDYKPLLVSEVYARGGEKIGEFYRENRILIPYEKIPKKLVQAFISAEDSTFFEHGGLNYIAIVRAFFENLRHGKKVQGGSTITQQVAKSLLLTSEKTLTRKIKEALLAYKMEEHLSKEEILYLYLNQIFFGEGAYGVVYASDFYFRKPVDQLTIAEMAILAGLPQAPSRYSPSRHPQNAKDRQRYVLGRMKANGYITAEEEKKALNEPITVYMGKEYKSVAPFFVETVRLMLVQQLGESQVLDGGLKIYTSLDFKAQKEAQEQVRQGLREVDKRQGFRGPLRHIASEQEAKDFLLEVRKTLQHDMAPTRIITPEGNLQPEKQLEVFHKKDAKGQIISNLPDYVSKGQIAQAVVTKVDDANGLVHVRFADVQALLDVADMSWARKPDAAVSSDNAAKVAKPSLILKAGDVIEIRVLAEKFTGSRVAKVKGKSEPSLKFDDYAAVALEQEPLVQGALLSFDQKTQDVMAMVGGYDYQLSEFNRTILSSRQTGSAFKALVYAAALDKGYTPSTSVVDAPLVYEGKDTTTNEGQDTETKTWKPHNYSEKFSGDILFRNALIRSMNIPTVKILEDIGIDWTMDYARRLGIFSPLNNDLSLALGSSGVTLYEMTKAFSQLGRMGQRIRPVLITKVLNPSGQKLLDKVSLDKHFDKEISVLDKIYEEKRQAALKEPASPTPEMTEAQAKKKKVPNLYFQDPDQLISPQSAYLITTLLSGVIFDEGGTAARARSLGRPVAGKTGTTNGYYDTWFVGYTPQVATGVWVGFDAEKSLGVGEAGGRTALPIWLEYMKSVHKDIPPTSFPVPSGIVFANIDNQSGKLASASSKSVVKQAFLAGTEPKELSGTSTIEDQTDFYKKDLTE